ncbi:MULTISPECIES: polysaccharide biosynthesis/export family protein [unclassified Paraflavitalea]|uniref:polysaccharide biosynthesis/export family protein n=1 Tax=unclassified Paraflavitalea TaxID=2798305 RepID=UPI003D33979F
MKKNLLWLLVPALLMFATTSCVTHKPVQYLEGSFDTIPLKNVQWKEPVVQPGDLISVVIYSDNASASALYNLNGSVGVANGINTGIATASNGNDTKGYLVDKDGNVTIVGVGKLLVGGKTKLQISNELMDYFKRNDLLKNPIVDVRFLNFKITVMGEVARPGSYSIPTEKVNLMEAIGLAGDFGPFARKDIVTIIREENGQRSFARLDMYDASIFASPYYQLQQNDIIIIPANKKKEAANDQMTLRYITVATSVISVTAILINLFK